MDNNIETEEWRDIEGYENLYEVSNLGRVRSIDRYVDNGNGNVKLVKGKTLSLQKNNKGYLYMFLWRNNKGTKCYIHRLVARAFQDVCGEYVNGLEVDHLDTNPSNNKATNLRWCTRKENCNNLLTLQHLFNANKGKAKGEKSYWYDRHGKDNPNSIPILQYDRQGNFIAEFESSSDAGRKLGISSGSICMVLKGRRNHTHGYIFRYKEQSQNKAI